MRKVVIKLLQGIV